MQQIAEIDVDRAAAEAATMNGNRTDGIVTREHIIVCTAFYEAMRTWLLLYRVRAKGMLTIVEGRNQKEVRTRVVASGHRGLYVRKTTGPHHASLFRCSLFMTPQDVEAVQWPMLADMTPRKHAMGGLSGRSLGVVVRWETTADALSLGSPRIA